MKKESTRARFDGTVLALLYITMGEEVAGVYWAWKSHDWDAIERLHGNGYIFISRIENQVGNNEGRGLETIERVVREIVFEDEVILASRNQVG